MIDNATNCSYLTQANTFAPFLTSSRTLLVFLAVCMSVFAAVTLFLNAVVIVAVCKSTGRGRSSSARSKRAGNNTKVVKLLMTSMAVADSIVALVIMPIRITELVHNGMWVMPFDKCKYRGTFSVYMCTVSIYHVACMAIDRYLAICRPLSYHVMTVNAGYVMAGLSWAVPVFIYPLPVLSEMVRLTDTKSGCIILSSTCGHNKTVLFSLLGAIASFYIPFSVICVFYLRVLIKVKKFHRSDKSIVSNDQNRIQRTATSNAFQNMKSESGIVVETILTASLPAIINNDSSLNSCNKFNDNTKMKDCALKKSGPRKRSRKALLTIGLIVMSFTLCWLPYAIFMEFFSSHADADIPQWFETMTMWLGYLNSAFNPVLFCFHRGIRLAVKKLLCP
ncbi:octopamine receptor beta-3R [Biomphalaria glabrata]|nr:octopamine receptor beta-3R [Biomphalaria glabrata]